MTKKFSSALCSCFLLLLLLLVLLRGTTCSMMSQHKSTAFRAKLREMGKMAPTNSLQSHSSDTKTNGRVFYPIGYGADPTGVQESSDAILQALKDAFQVQSSLELLPGVTDLGGVVIDLQGGSYQISKPIRFPASGGGNVVLMPRLLALLDGTSKTGLEFLR